MPTALHSTLCGVTEPCDRCAQPDHCRVNGCFGEKARGVAFRTGMPATVRERQMAKDNDAYKRLKAEGIQPPRVDGSHRLEHSL